MKLPAGACDLAEAKDLLKLRYVAMERRLVEEVEDLANSGFSDQRWCAIARTHLQEGMAALRRALRDEPLERDSYAKVAMPEGRPDFRQPADPEPLSNVGAQQHIEWKDVG